VTREEVETLAYYNGWKEAVHTTIQGLIGWPPKRN